MIIPYNKSNLIDITITVSFLPASGWKYAFSIIRDDDPSSSMYSWGLRMLNGRIVWLTPYGSMNIVTNGLNQVYTIRMFNYPSTGSYPQMWTQLDDGEPSSVGNIYNDKKTSNAGTLLFGMQFFNVEAPVGSPVRIYSFSGISNNSPIDLMPVRVGEIGYMYDRVSGELFGNMGTGEFILGPDLED